MAHRTIECSIYHVTIHITTSRASAVKVFKKVLTPTASADALASIDQPNASGYAFDCTPHGVIIHIKHKRPDVIAHECLHAAAYILSDRGVKFDPDNHEAYAYYMGWLIREVMATK